MGNDEIATPYLSVVIPARNEEDRLPKTLGELDHRLGALGVSFEVIVVNDGSYDNTAHLAKSQGAHVINHIYGKGIAAAFRSGSRFSHGEIIMLCPADIRDFSFLTDAMYASQAFDVVSVSKRHAKSKVVGYDKWRWFLSNGYQKCVNLLFGPLGACTDTHYVKLYNRRRLLKIIHKCRINGPVGETEMMLLARDAACSFSEVPGKIIHDSNGSKTSFTLILRAIIDLGRLYIQRKLNMF